MEVLAPIFAWGLQAVCNTYYAPWIPSCGIHYDDMVALVQRLSPKAEVLLPNSKEFKESTMRWSGLEQPTFRYSVVAATQYDVAETVKYANENNIPFLAVTSGHGSNMATDKIIDGIHISLRKLNSIDFSPDGRSVTVGGGILTQELSDRLWAHKKQTVTGFCECTGYVGPALGGGHGALQGRHGLIADQILSMNVVLADGSSQTVDETSDLWWAMRGAGHNFGIVTSIKSKIYDIEHDRWAHKTYMISQHQAGDLYSVLNDRVGKQPADVQHHSIVVYNPILKRALIMVVVFQEGVEVVDPIYTEPIERLAGVFPEPSLDYTEYGSLAMVLGANMNGQACQKSTDQVKYRLPIYLDQYNATAMQHMVDDFDKFIKKNPKFEDSMILVEGYGVEAVKRVPADSSAVAYRDKNLLISPIVIAPPSVHKKVKKEAKAFMNEIMQDLHRASGNDKIQRYVNYAYGDESTESIYGDGKRLEKLRALKKKYDPNGKFNFYSPIE